ncbi:lysine decarboxylase domain-containing protein [Strigomonas culicis]|uniref:Lysine decarboxylase domain-containing protein n=1 Tax=Strigomonas culicis TaxID=28005 RepID=S9VA97_9TRYP|nr:lysine decarboxylase domain-containing protein [Strigomonas culicis]EPY27822.1 lysine decarboxylase domain-containing protein [Strigomonas culicis]|eukprot:EPY19930.1 lysine decarboxylase domain-containing protein [Strigomonas culicis]
MPSPNSLNLSAKFSPYIQKDEDATGRCLKPTTKSYKSDAFLASREGRLIRVLCEFEEPKVRLQRNYIRSTVLFFGSARAMTPEQYARTLCGLEAQRAELLAQQQHFTDPAEQRQAAAQADTVAGEIENLRKTEWMCVWVQKAEILAREIALFAQREAALVSETFQSMPDYFNVNLAEVYPEEAPLEPPRHAAPGGSPTTRSPPPEMVLRHKINDLVVTTGGGPGFMEAANKGAASVAGTKTIGMGISLPFEKGLNPFVSDDLAFEFHYFFSRKFWMMYSCRGIIVAPGGFGTMDELFELLTLKQTKKIPNLPVVLFGKQFWQTVVNWQALSDYGVISQREIDQMCFTDEVDEAIAFIRRFYRDVVDRQKAKAAAA